MGIYYIPDGLVSDLRITGTPAFLGGADTNALGFFGGDGTTCGAMIAAVTEAEASANATVLALIIADLMSYHLTATA